MTTLQNRKRTLFLLAAAIVCAVSFPFPKASAAPIHLWDFAPGNELADSFGGLNLNVAIGEGNVLGVFGTAGDLSYEPGFGGIGQAYRPYYVDVTQSSTAGVGLTGSGFTSPNQFTIEAIVKADLKSSGSAVNYIFQTRPGSDRGYYLVQDEDNVPGGTTSGLGTIVGNNFSDAAVPVGQNDDGHWFYIAAVIDLTSVASQASANWYAADLMAGETTPTLLLNNRTWNTANPSALAGATGIFGIGNFAIDRDADTVAEASQEWFQGAIDYVAIYDGLLSERELAANLDGRLNPVPEPSTSVLTALGCLGLFAVRRRNRA